MDYRDILGFSNTKKKTVKKESKPKKTIVDGIKQELNEWSDSIPSVKRWSKNFNGSRGLTEFEKNGGKDIIKEVGNAQVHKKYTMKIEDGAGNLEAAVKNYSDFLNKQGHKKEAQELRGKFSIVGKFTHWMKTKWVRMLRKMI